MMEPGEIIYQKVYVSPRPPPKIIGQRLLDERIGFRSPLEAAKTPNESNQMKKNPMIKNRETFLWTRIHPGDRERCTGLSRRHQALDKNGETRRLIRVHQGGGARK